MTKPLPRQPFLNEIVLRPKSGLSKLLYGLFDHNPDDTPYTLTFTQTSPGVFQATHASGKKVYADAENGMRWTESDGVTPADPPGSDITRPGQPDPHVNKHGLMLKLWRYWKESTMGAGDDSPPPAGVPYDELAPPTTGDTSGMTKGHFGSTAISHAATSPMLASGPRTHPITDVVEPGGERHLADYTTLSPDEQGQAQSHGSEQPSTSGFDPDVPIITPTLTPSASGGTMLSGDVRYRLTNRKTISGVVAESDKGPIISASVTGPHGSVSVHADAETDTSIEGRLLYREDPSSPDRWHLVHEEAGHDAFTFVDTKSFTVLRHDNYGLTRHGLYPKYDGARQIPASGGGGDLAPFFRGWGTDNLPPNDPASFPHDVGTPVIASGYANFCVIDTGPYYDPGAPDRLTFPEDGLYEIHYEIAGSVDPITPTDGSFDVTNAVTLNASLLFNGFDQFGISTVPDAVSTDPMNLQAPDGDQDFRTAQKTTWYNAAAADYMQIQVWSNALHTNLVGSVGAILVKRIGAKTAQFPHG